MATPKFKKSKVTQEIDLQELFGVDFKGRRDLREALGEAMLEKIRARTARGVGMKFSSKRGTPVKLKAYSKQYKESEEFEAHGKSPSKVNMNLTGTMMDTMDIVKQTGNKITLGWDEDEENAKAFNHNTPKSKEAPLPQRPFFGLNKSELKEIAKDFKKDIKSIVKDGQDKSDAAFNANILALIDKVGKDDG